MDNQAKTEHLLSIRMRVHPAWYLAAILITGILVTQYSGDYPLRERIFLGLIGSLLFLASMTVVQFLTNLASLLLHIPAKNVTLFVFGGVTQVPEDSTSAGREAIVAVVNLLLNILVAAVFYWLYLGQTGTFNSPIVLLLEWLAFFWYMLALFHIFPAFPLAGGRILAAVIWKATGSYLRSMHIVTPIGWCFAAGLILGGVILLLRSSQLANGLLLLFFGWVLLGAVTLSSRRATLLGALQNTKMKKMAAWEFPSIGPDLKLTELIRDNVLVTGQHFFVVTDQGKLLGVVTTEDIKHISKKLWALTSVSMMMTPGRIVRTVSGEQSGAHALEVMDQFNIDHIPVLENGQVIGVVGRDSLYRFARIRAQLKV